MCPGGGPSDSINFPQYAEAIVRLALGRYETKVPDNLRDLGERWKFGMMVRQRMEAQAREDEGCWGSNQSHLIS